MGEDLVGDLEGLSRVEAEDLLGGGDLLVAQGGAVGLAALLVTHNPVGLAVQAGVQGYGELSGSAKIQGRAKQTAKEIAEQLKIRFKEQGWVQ